MRSALVLASLVSVACSGGSDGLAPIAPPTSKPPAYTGAPVADATPPPEVSHPPLAVKVDGAIVEIKSAIAASMGGRSIRLALSTEPLDCKRSSFSDSPGLKDGRTDFNVVLAPRIDANSPELKWTVSSISYGGNHDSAPRDTNATAHSIDPKAGAENVVGLTFTSKYKEHVLSVSGTATAKSCGPILQHKDAKLVAQDDAKLVLGGQAIKLRSAILETTDEGHTRLTLGSDGLRCNRSNDGDVVLALTFSGKPLTLEGGDLAGYMLGSSASVYVEGSDLQLASMGAGKPGDTVEVAIAKTGKLDLSGLAGELRGKVKAVRCPKDTF
jgi:hypothetical protein